MLCQVERFLFTGNCATGDGRTDLYGARRYRASVSHSWHYAPLALAENGRRDRPVVVGANRHTHREKSEPNFVTPQLPPYCSSRVCILRRFSWSA
jgi:hypothetical protein